MISRPVDLDGDFNLFHEAQIEAYNQYMHDIKAIEAKMEALGVKNYKPPADEQEEHYKWLFFGNLIRAWN